ncbi:MAG: hypothetical protein F6J93_02620 [Oscillatoria sp. SIO1A7]|nr:hypothetical protein [Oscillatoria sp. SIO1A7]
MLGPLQEARRHQSRIKQSQISAGRGTRTPYSGSFRSRNAWMFKQETARSRFEELPDILASLESFQEKGRLGR